MTTDKKVDGWIDDIVGALFDPIVVYPGGWGEDLPQWLKNRITIERLAENIVAVREDREITATDAEATWYLSSASLTFPLPHDWAEIYLYLATHELKDNKDKVIPDDIKVESLTESQWHDLKRLKTWIYEQRVKHRRERARLERREDHQVKTEAKDKELETAPVQARFF